MEEQEQNRIDVDELMEQGKFDNAIKVLKKCVSVLPKDDERLGGVYFMIGKTYRAKEDYVKAEEYFQRSVDHGEEIGIVDPIPLRELVSTLAWQGKTGQAWKYYAQLQIHDSDPVRTRAMLIPIMVKNGEYQGAIDSYESLVPKHQYFQLLPHVAEAQEGLLNYTAASHSLQEYLDKMDPHHPHVPVALYRFAMVQLMMFNGKRAVELAQECVKRCRPENKEIRMAALHIFKEIMKKKPKRAGKRRMPRSK